MNSVIVILSLLIVIAEIAAKPLSYIISLSKPLVITVTKQFTRHNVIQIRNYLAQADEWSCGLRAVFHALAIEKALKTPRNFKEVLKIGLRNQKALKKLYTQYGKDKGLWDYHIQRLADKNGIGNKLICLTAKKDEITLLDSKETSLDLDDLLHKELNRLMAMVKREPQAIYFVVTVGDHWVLFSLVNLPQRPVTLLVIDSDERSLAHFNLYTQEGIANEKKFIRFLRPYLSKLNKDKRSTMVF